MKQPEILVSADDYAIAPGVSAAIRDLAARGRIGGTSCMTTTPYWPDEGKALRALDSGIQVGVHLAFTGAGRPSLGAFWRDCVFGRVARTDLIADIDRQLDAFERVYGAPPDFIDGHQHTHQFPVARDALFDVWARRLAGRPAWLRVSATPRDSLKGAALAALGSAMRARAARHGIRTNDRLTGAYDFSNAVPYGERFARFVAQARGFTVVMCHPGIVDDALRAADELTDAREREYAFFAGDAYAPPGLRAA